ncbi:MAG: carboxymuconolactone decarboxylase family protein [Marinobacterium sp.]|nr:carboxymuconolactone decarboxylase family protein [Marinobacterium sp.]
MLNQLTETLITGLPEGSDDLATLLQRTLMQETGLDEAYRCGVALAAACALRNPTLVATIRAVTPPQTQTIVRKAVERMGVTNPYFQVRMVAEIGAGGSLQALAMPPLEDTDVADETAYHYYAVAISAINGGMPCYRSHLMDLLHSGQSSQAIDQALRLVAALHSVDQLQLLA